ncbi:YlxQ family RNA-binding protein [Listeria sp. PSOL-1]|uniref:YlxQ family RNA-binding protein n=1 Tax=Listeria sp. PSOL-1 TaxID=1844999 RepID=UPI0013D64294|nr:YlxQ family RNA-binding protein [Listeria sp. PSOL-1]
MNDKFFSLLGLAYRAKKITTGEELVLKAVRRKQTSLVIMSTDVSESTAKKIRSKCEYYDVALCEIGTREQLGGAIGKESRALLAVLDKGFSKKLSELLG